MNLTQRMIILVGSEELLLRALEIVKGFKAVTVVNNVTDEIVKNVYRHNKNVVVGRTSVDLTLSQYDPVMIRLTANYTNVNLQTLSVKSFKTDFPTILDSMNIDAGDHKSEDSKDSVSVQRNCMLCNVMESNPNNEHILYESNNFFVVPGLGAFFDGYCMIVPKRHVMSFAELSPGEYEEFLQVMDDMKFILKSIYGQEIFAFECGSGRNGGGKHATSIVHAHFHLAPTDMPVLSNVIKSGLYPAQITSRDLRSYGKYPYMLYIDQDNNWFITQDPDTYFPRQHPRQILADYMGLPKGKFNWRTNPLRERLDVIAEEVYTFFKDNFDNLPKWIQQNVAKFTK